MGQASRRKRERREARQEGRAKPHRPTSSRAKKLTQLALALVIVVLVGTTIWVTTRDGRTSRSDQRAAPATIQATTLHTDFEVEPETLNELLVLPSEQLAMVDIARANLLVAQGLPHAESLDIDATLAKLDEWAERVRAETDRHLYRFRMNPAEYEHSEAYYRMLMLVTVLQQDLGVQYNMQRAFDIDFTDSRDLFIHGMLGDGAGGTCVSMPVLYTAVARRLGYPVKLVTTKAHVFARWDAADHENPRLRGRFNIEATNQGMNSFDDEYYTTWPARVSAAEIAADNHLQSLSREEELALFLATRGHCLHDIGERPEAVAVYGKAMELAPHVRLYRGFRQQAMALHTRPTPRSRPGRNPMADLRNIYSINEANRRRMESQMQQMGAPDPMRPQQPQHGQWPHQPLPRQHPTMPARPHSPMEPSPDWGTP